VKQLTGKDYLAAIRCEIAKSGKIKAAVAFWATDSELLFKGRKKEDVQILCDLSMGGSREPTIRRLCNDFEVKQVDSLHAKVMIFEKALIVGSANASISALGNFAGDPVKEGKHVEYGFLIENADEIERATKWFDSFFDDPELASPISKANLKKLEKMNSVGDNSRKKIRDIKNEITVNPHSILQNLRANPSAFPRISFVFITEDANEDLLEEAAKNASRYANKELSSEHETKRLMGFTDWESDAKKFSDLIIEFNEDPKGRIKIFAHKKIYHDPKTHTVLTEFAAHYLKAEMKKQDVAINLTKAAEVDALTAVKVFADMKREGEIGRLFSSGDELVSLLNIIEPRSGQTEVIDV
jgi:CheY-like chemotaxis protein